MWSGEKSSVSADAAPSIHGLVRQKLTYEPYPRQDVPLVEYLFAGEPHRVREGEPVSQPALPFALPVLERDARDPLPAYLGQWAVRDDGAVLLGEAPLVVPAVGDPRPDLVRRAAAGVEPQVERVPIPVARRQPA